METEISTWRPKLPSKEKEYRAALEKALMWWNYYRLSHQDNHNSLEKEDFEECIKLLENKIWA